MQEKKKGFTLIELLAVIVILAIIALIATPIVLKLIETSRKGSFTRSAEGVLKSAKLYYASSLLKIEGVDDIEFYCNNVTCTSSELDENENNITLDVDGNMGTGTVIITHDGKISFELDSGTYCAEKTQEEEKITVSKKNCNEIIINKPTGLSISSKTEKLGVITVVGKVDNKPAEIKSYEFSIDNGATWKTSGNNVYTFTGLGINTTYKVLMRVTNQNDESAQTDTDVTTLSMSNPDYEITPSGDVWAVSKTVTINYPDIDTNIYKKVYRLDDESTFTEYDEAKGIPLTENKSIVVDIQKKDDNTSILESTITINVIKIDTSNPTSSNFVVTNKTSNSITVKAAGTDDESGITMYEFSKDNGVTWEGLQASDIYTFTGLTQYTDYNIKVRVYNGTYETGGRLYKESDVQTIKTEAAKYKITFNANGGTVSTTEKEVTYNSEYGVLPTPTYSGYGFIGWYTDKDNGDKIEETTIVTITNNQTLYAHWKQKDTLINKTYTTGEAVTLGGYNWHVIGDTGTQVTLLMDANQLGDNSNMAHCGNVNDNSNNCTFNGSYYVYSWDKSLIRTYLNSTLLSDLESKISNEIVSTSICADPSKVVTGGLEQSYGGYLMSELESLGKTSSCSNTVSDKVRLITYSEYYNMSPYYTSTSSSYPNVEKITKLSTSSDYASWLYCNSSICGASYGSWWSMSSYSSSFADSVRSVRYVRSFGDLDYSYVNLSSGVRPVVTIVK